MSAGWRDLYERSLTFQWVDVSLVRPGLYWLREDIDPTHIVREANPKKVPAYATPPVTIPGYNAKGLTLRSRAPGSPITITLDATRCGPTGAAQYRVDAPPKHGTISVQAGSLFTNPTIIYRPHSGYHGPDQFTYTARDSESRYPYNPVQATVSLNPRSRPHSHRSG